MAKSAKKKIALLCAFYEPFMSGAEQMPREIIKRLGLKYDITLLAARLERRLPAEEVHKNYKLVRLGIGSRKFDKLSYPFLAALKIRRIKPKIAHANLESYAGLALAWLKIFYPRAKRILTLQSGNIDDPRQKKNFFIKLFWRRINFSPHLIIAISGFLRDRSLRLGVPPERIVVIPNGVDFSEVTAIKPIKHRVFFGGRLSWEKGAEYVFKSWPAVLERVPDARLVQVGGGDMKEEIIKLIKKLGIESSVKLLPAMPRRDYIREMKKAEVMVCPSLAEGLGISFIEAQACGVPVIGTNVGGIPDIIKDKKNGLLIEPRDTDAVAGAIINLLQDRELARRISAQAIRTVKRFEWGMIVERIDRVYSEVLDDKN